MFTNLGQRLTKKVDFFLIVESILLAGFFDKMLALSNKKSNFVPVSGFFGYCIFAILFKYYLNGGFSLRRHLKVDDYLRKKGHLQALKFSWSFSHIKGKKIPQRK